MPSNSVEPRHVEPAVAGAGGDHDGPGCAISRAVVEPHGVVAVALVQADRLGRHADGGAELLGLDHRAVGQLGAGDAGREAEVVLDPGRGAGLPAGGDRVEHDRRQPFGGAVHGGGEPGRARADDDEVAQPVPGAPAPAGRRPGPARRCRGCAARARRARSPPASRPALTPSWRSSASALGSSSRSIQVCGSRLRAANSRSRRVSGEYRDPTILMPATAADQQLPAAAGRPAGSGRRAAGRAPPGRAARPAGTASTSPVSTDHRRDERRLAGEQAELVEEAARAVDPDQPLARRCRTPRPRRPCRPGRRRSRGPARPPRTSTSPALDRPAARRTGSARRCCSSRQPGKGPGGVGGLGESAARTSRASSRSLARDHGASCSVRRPTLRSAAAGAAPAWRATTWPSAHDHQRGHGLHREPLGQLRRRVDVDLDQLHLAGQVAGDLLQRRADHAGTGRTRSPTGRPAPGSSACSTTSAKSSSPASAIHGSGWWQLPHRGHARRPPAGTRFLRPQCGHCDDRSQVQPLGSVRVRRR